MAASWAPALTDVAVHILSRTRQVGTDDSYAGTFTADTTPTDTQVGTLIGQACTTVTSRTGLPVMTAVPEVAAQCTLAAALWTAYWVELSFPERDADVAVYERIRVDAEAATKAAGEMNAAAGGGASTDPTDGSAHLPTHSFPPAPAWADITFW